MTKSTNTLPLFKIATIELYLSWFNDFLTAQCFADYYGLTINEADTIIILGRKYNEELANGKGL